MAHFLHKEEHFRKIYMPEDSVGYHVFVSVKALHTNAGIQYYSYYTTSVFGKFLTRMNIGNEVGRSITVFRESQRQMVSVKQ